MPDRPQTPRAPGWIAEDHGDAALVAALVRGEEAALVALLRGIDRFGGRSSPEARLFGILLHRARRRGAADLERYLGEAER